MILNSRKGTAISSTDLSTNGTPRRTVLRGIAWGAPTVLVSASAPALATSHRLPQLGVVFDGGGGANGYLNSMYLNLRSAGGRDLTLAGPVTVTIEVIGLNRTVTAEQSMTIGSSYGTLVRARYDRTTYTTRITWTLPTGTFVPTTSIATSNPDILFTFNDGLASGGRITNKVVVTGITGGTISAPGPPPVDSSVVKDHDRSAASPDGVY